MRTIVKHPVAGSLPMPVGRMMQCTLCALWLSLVSLTAALLAAPVVAHEMFPNGHYRQPGTNLLPRAGQPDVSTAAPAYRQAGVVSVPGTYPAGCPCAGGMGNHYPAAIGPVTTASVPSGSVPIGSAQGLHACGYTHPSGQMTVMPGACGYDNRAPGSAPAVTFAPANPSPQIRLIDRTGLPTGTSKTSIKAAN